MASEQRREVIRVVTISTREQGYYMLGFLRGVYNQPSVLIGTMATYVLQGRTSAFAKGYATAADIRWLNL